MTAIIFPKVQGNVDPPVCKMMDFKREQYKRKVKEKDRAKEKVICIVKYKFSIFFGIGIEIR